MQSATKKRLRYYLQLDYPVHVVLDEWRFLGCFPDLPGARVEADDAHTLYSRLQQLRAVWIADRLDQGLEVPLPHSA
jgi:predicted RNase H-like HicB family nuclease